MDFILVNFANDLHSEGETTVKRLATEGIEGAHSSNGHIVNGTK